MTVRARNAVSENEQRPEAPRANHAHRFKTLRQKRHVRLSSWSEARIGAISPAGAGLKNDFGKGTGLSRAARTCYFDSAPTRRPPTIRVEKYKSKSQIK